jgi:hypothetical protein
MMKLTITQNKERPMIYKEARECVDKINANLSSVRSLVLELHDRDGWSALGYSTWTECVQKEFQQSERYIFYQYKAAQIEQNINDFAKTNCTKVQLGAISETHLRPLSKIKDAEKQREVWNKAVETAPDGKLTAAHVSAVVKNSLNPIVIEMESEVEIKVKEDSLNLSKLKAVWNVCDVADKRRFVKWQKEYFHRYME